MEQMDLALGAHQPPAIPKRRIDITLERLEVEFNALPDEERTQLIGLPWLHTLEMMAALRGMEMAGEEVRGHSLKNDLAEIYDRIVTPGEHPIEALLRVFREYFT